MKTIALGWLIAIGLILSLLLGNVLKAPAQIDTNGNFLLLFVMPLILVILFSAILFIVLVIEKQLFKKSYLYLAIFWLTYTIIDVSFSMRDYGNMRETLLKGTYVPERWSQEDLLQYLTHENTFSLQTATTYLYFNMETFIAVFALIYICLYTIRSYQITRVK